MRKNYIRSFMLMLLILLSTESVLGKENFRNPAIQEQKTAQAEVFLSEEEIPSIRTRENDSANDSIEVTEEPNFLIKLGTFLLITAVLLFLIQWQHKKNKND